MPGLNSIEANSVNKLWLPLSLIAILLSGHSLLAADLESKPFAEQRVILQISDSDAQRQAMILSISNNLIKHYGSPDLIDIEIIAFGPGVSFLFAAGNPHQTMINSLMKNNVRFYVCENTLQTIEGKQGRIIDLLEGVVRVPTGVAFLVEEIQAGYTAVNP